MSTVPLLWDEPDVYVRWISRPVEIPPLVQNPKGYRFSVDSVLLGQMIQCPPHATVVDLGTGCGVLLILIALQYPTLRRGIGIEIQASLIRLAKRNAYQWRLKDRLQWIHGDIRRIRRYMPTSVADVVITNPPYRPATRGQLSPTTERAIACHEISANLRDFLMAARRVVKPSGQLYLIYPYRRRHYLAHQVFLTQWQWRWVDFCQMPHKPVPQFIRLLLLPPGYGQETAIDVSRTWFSSQRAGYQTERFEDPALVMETLWPEAYVGLRSRICAPVCASVRKTRVDPHRE